MRLSIRWKLTLWYMLALAVVLGGFGTVVYGLLVHALYERIDEVLFAQLNLLDDNTQDERMVNDRRGRLAYLIDEFKEHANVFVAVYDSRGEVFARTQQLEESSVPPSPTTTSGQHRSENVTLPLIGRQRILAARIPLGNEE